MKPIGPMRSIKTVGDIRRLSPEQLQQLQYQRLHKLVDYARRNSPYWQELLQDLPEGFTLADLPITRKGDLAQQFERCITDPKVTLAGLQEFMQSPENIGKMFLGKYLPVTTSGTTSRPALLLLDENALSFLTALGVKRLDISKEALRKALKNGGRTAGIQSTSGFYSSNCLIRLRQLRHPLQSGRFRIVPAALSPWEQAAMLNRYKPSNISAHPSLLWRLINASRDTLSCRPAMVVTSGETLFPHQRQAIEAAFPGCQLLSNYVSAEGGLIATQCATGNYHLNSDCVILEPVNRDLTPTPPGELSWGVLVTNLSNFIQPVIRYLLEDRVRFLPESCSCGNILPPFQLEGRADETLLLPSHGGIVEILPREIVEVFVSLPSVEEFQLVQTGARELDLRLALREGVDPAQGRLEAQARLADFLRGRGVRVEIHLSSHRPAPLPHGGKFQPVCREWTKTIFEREEPSCVTQY